MDIATRPGQANVDLAIGQREAQEAQLEDATIATIQRDSLQNQPENGEAGTSPSQPHVVSLADRSQRQQEPQSATPGASPTPVSAKPRAENEQATASQNQAHRSPSESARPPKPTGQGRQRRATRPHQQERHHSFLSSRISGIDSGRGRKRIPSPEEPVWEMPKR